VVQGGHILFTETAWSPPIPIFERIVSIFPALSLVDFHISDEMGNFFYMGSISAVGTNLVEDKEAERRWNEVRSACSADDEPCPF
jgi:hypothetical protein